MAYSWQVGATPTFRALSYDEYAAPLREATELHKDIEEKYGMLDEQASEWEKLANNAHDQEAYLQAKRYADDLRAQADNLAQYGLKFNSRNSLMNMKSRYAQEILPIKEAYELRKQRADEWAAAVRNNPYLVTNRNPGEESLSLYMSNPNWHNETFDLQKEYTRLSGQIANIKNSVFNDIEELAKKGVSGDTPVREAMKWSKVPGIQWLYEIAYQKGWNMSELRNQLNNENSWLNAVVEQSIIGANMHNWDYRYSYEKGEEGEAAAELRKQNTLNNARQLLKQAGYFGLGDYVSEKFFDQGAMERYKQGKEDQRLALTLGAKYGNQTDDGSYTGWLTAPRTLDVNDPEAAKQLGKMNRAREYMILKMFLGGDAINKKFEGARSMPDRLSQGMFDKFREYIQSVLGQSLSDAYKQGRSNEINAAIEKYVTENEDFRKGEDVEGGTFHHYYASSDDYKGIMSNLKGDIDYMDVQSMPNQIAFLDNMIDNMVTTRGRKRSNFYNDKNILNQFDAMVNVPEGQNSTLVEDATNKGHYKLNVLSGSDAGGKDMYKLVDNSGKPTGKYINAATYRHILQLAMENKGDINFKHEILSGKNGIGFNQVVTIGDQTYNIQLDRPDQFNAADRLAATFGINREDNFGMSYVNEVLSASNKDWNKNLTGSEISSIKRLAETMLTDNNEKAWAAEMMNDINSQNPEKRMKARQNLSTFMDYFSDSVVVNAGLSIVQRGREIHPSTLSKNNPYPEDTWSYSNQAK